MNPRQEVARAWLKLSLVLLAIIALLFIANSAHGQSCVTTAQVTLTGNLRGANGIPTKNATLTLTPSQLGFIPACGLNLPTANTCGTSTDGSVVGVPNPLTPTINTTSATGSLPGPRIYYTMYEWYDAAGHVTLPSPETATTFSGGAGALVINPPASGVPSNAAGMDVFIGITSGGETLQGQSTGSAAYVQSSALISGASPDATNTTLCQVIANDAVFPTGTGYIAGMTDSNGNQMPGFPMQWQLMGPGTTINLSNGLPYYHGVVNFPAPILAQPANHGQQSISGPLSLGGYNLSGVNKLTANNINSIVINGEVNVADYLTAGDMGQAFAAAYAANGANANYWIPAGIYVYTHTIAFPAIDTGNISLSCAPGTQLNYTGTGDAFSVIGTGQSKIGHILDGCFFLGTSAGASGIHLEAVNGANITNNLVYSFTNGDGILNRGANSITYNSNWISGNKNNIHNVGFVLAGSPSNCFAANQISFTAGLLANATSLQIYEDATHSADACTGGTVGVNEDNSYSYVAIEASTNIASQVFVQGCQGCTVGPKNYIETPVSGAFTNQILLGDATYSAIKAVVIDNFFATNGATLTNAINCVNCNRSIVRDNLDDGDETNFLNNGALSTWTDLAFNYSGSSNYKTGSGTYTAIETETTLTKAIFNSTTGFEYNGAAPSRHYLIGNGTNYIDGTIQQGDLPATSAQTIANGTATMTTAAITAPACGSTITVAATGVAATDTISWAFNAAPAGTNAGLVAWPTTNNVNFAYCPGVTETPAAATINWRVAR